MSGTHKEACFGEKSFAFFAKNHKIFISSCAWGKILL